MKNYLGLLSLVFVTCGCNVTTSLDSGFKLALPADPLPSASPGTTPSATPALTPTPTPKPSTPSPTPKPTVTPTPTPIAGTKAPKIAAGGNHTCAALSDGTSKCWGSNASGELGDGTNNNSNIPVTVKGLSNVVSIAAGFFHSCAVLSDGSVKCWGKNDTGQLGTGAVGTDSSTPVTVTGLSGAVAIAAGGIQFGNAFSCAIVASGTVKCWGSNANGQLGTGTKTSSPSPIAVSGVSGAVAIAAGGIHACAALSDGTVKCWGVNSEAELGDGTQANRALPVTAKGLTTAVSVSAGRSSSCALLSDKTEKCWGTLDAFVPAGTQQVDLIPTSVFGLTGAVVSIASGEAHDGAVLSSGAVWAWGNNDTGQIGNGTVGTNVIFAVQTTGLSTAVQIAAGQHHTCAALSDGSIKCWGQNGSGQLGNASNTGALVPVAVSGF